MQQNHIKKERKKWLPKKQEEVRVPDGHGYHLFSVTL